MAESSYVYLINPAFQFINVSGKPLVDGYINLYISGTRSKYYAFSDFDGTLHPFNIPLNALGSAVILVSPAHSYDIYVYNSVGTLQMSRYNITPATGEGTVITDVTTLTSKDGTVDITASSSTDYDLSIATKIAELKEYTDQAKNDAIESANTSIADLDDKKKDKQDELNFNGSATKTVKKITQYPNGELDVEFEDISAGGISAGTAIDMTDNTVSVKYSKGLEINIDNQLQVNTDIIASKKSVDEVKSDLNNLTGTVNNHTNQIEQIQQILINNSWTELICRPYDSTIELMIMNAGYRNGFLNFNGTVHKIDGTFTMNEVNYLFTVDGIALKLDFRNYYGSGAYNSTTNLFPCAMAALKNTSTFYIYPTQTCNIFYFNGTVPVDLITKGAH